MSPSKLKMTNYSKIVKYRFVSGNFGNGPCCLNVHNLKINCHFVWLSKKILQLQERILFLPSNFLASDKSCPFEESKNSIK